MKYIHKQLQAKTNTSQQPILKYVTPGYLSPKNLFKTLKTRIWRYFSLKRNQRRAVYASLSLVCIGLFVGLVFAINQTIKSNDVLYNRKIRLDRLNQQYQDVKQQKAITEQQLQQKAAREQELMKQIDDLNKQVQAKRAAQIAVQAVQPKFAATFVPISHYSGSLADWLFKLRSCESGGNYQTNTGNGYYGAYQFTIPTWNHWGTGYARADLAPPSVQDATVIKNTNASSGGLASQNPGCYYKMGLSAYPPG